MFALPVNGEIPVNGNSLESPIVLEGVDERHFQVFLRALYPLYVRPQPLTKAVEISMSDPTDEVLDNPQ
jgi:hypothetical protein